MKGILKSILGNFGLTIIRLDTLAYFENKARQGPEEMQYGAKNNLIRNVFQVLIEAGFTPKHIMDVGANHGTWTREVMGYFKDSCYTLIEPQSEFRDSVRDLLDTGRVIFLPIGLSDKPGKLMFTIVDRDDSCNFRMSTEEAEANGFKQVEVEVDTVDGIVEKSPFGVPDILKIDAEGLDLKVLDGAGSIMGKTEVILIEAAVVCKILENDLVSVINYMDRNGYRLFDVTDLNRPFEKRVLWLVELLFVKKDGFIDSKNWI